MISKFLLESRSDFISCGCLTRLRYSMVFEVSWSFSHIYSPLAPSLSLPNYTAFPVLRLETALPSFLSYLRSCMTCFEATPGTDVTRKGRAQAGKCQPDSVHSNRRIHGVPVTSRLCT